MTATLAQVVYGITLEKVDDEYYQMVKRITDIAEEISIPGRFLAEAFPVLRYVPSWFPGAGFKRFAALAKEDVVSIVDALYRAGVERVGKFLSPNVMLPAYKHDTT